jgi:hypothetical protein
VRRLAPGLNLSAYLHSLGELPRLKRSGFRLVALHPMLFPSIETGVPPSEDRVREVNGLLAANGMLSYDLATFNAWNALGLSGMMEQLPSGPLDPEYEEVRRRGGLSSSSC